jgi:hypothetical protein
MSFLSLDPSMIVDESLLPARSSVDRRRTRRVDPFEIPRSALGRDRRLVRREDRWIQAQ